MESTRTIGLLGKTVADYLFPGGDPVRTSTGDILLQFLVEAVAISLLGGIAGVGVGALLGHHLAASSLVHGSLALGRLFWPSHSQAWQVFFGYDPAHKAAFLDPIEALRYK